MRLNTCCAVISCIAMLVSQEAPFSCLRYQPTGQHHLSPPDRTRVPSQDTTGAIIRFLEARDMTIVTVHARRLSDFAVEVLRNSDSTRYIVAAAYRAGSVFPLSDPLELLGLGPWDYVQEVEWMSLAGTPVDLLRITFDDPIEKPVGTHLYRFVDGRLIDNFHDAIDVCTPAELRDVDGDGVKELITWGEDPTGNDCDEGCKLAVRDFGVSLAWASVNHWADNEWVRADHEYPGFYADLAARYERVLDVLPEWRRVRCPYSRWTDGRVISGWAERARRIADGGE